MAASVAPSSFKDAVLNFKTRIFTNAPLPDPRHLGVYLLTKVIPQMDANGEHSFAWIWAAKDVGVYNQQEYETETEMYRKKHKMRKADGDTTWFYDYTLKGKKRRCVMTTEIWYKEGKEHNVSPIAYLFGQFMANGFHITKCRFEDAPAE